MNDILKQNIMYVKGVGPKKAQLFSKVGIFTVYDLLEYYPRDYIDLSQSTNIRSCPNDEFVVIYGRIVKKNPPSCVRRGMTVYQAVFTDDTEDIVLVFFNQEYLFSSLREDENYIVYGKLSGNFVRREMNSPSVYPIDIEERILPVYPLTEGLSQKVIRMAVESALKLVEDKITDFLPDNIRDECAVCTLDYAWKNIHFPGSMYSALAARQRLIFDELFIHSLAVAYQRVNNISNSSYIMKKISPQEFYDILPFEMTNSQKRTLDECINGMCENRRMNRLIQGDVGSGKTAVAAGAAWFAFKNGYQSCVMAPTEILASQHYETFKKYLAPLGIKVALLTGSMTPKKKKQLQQQLADGEFDVAVGTHALFSENTNFKNLALVITDEQHRFGVNQRAKLSAKGNDPHRIVMSATPIPRTLALIFYGDLDISVIDELPKGRKKITTYAVTGRKREGAFEYVKKQLEQGRQGYVVCPAVEESEMEVIDAVSYSQMLSQGVFKDYKVGLLHGKLPSSEKESVMQDFKDGKIDVLVATTVVEVGVDVPNATFMIIENADRFGLSQLHQLRGRVGRGQYESLCIMITDNRSPECAKRLMAVASTNDGFKIAEEDLRLRGPGDFFGTHQHGVPIFKLADLSRDIQILEKAQTVSKDIIMRDSTLSLREHVAMKELVNILIRRKTELN